MSVYTELVYSERLQCRFTMNEFVYNVNDVYSFVYRTLRCDSLLIPKQGTFYTKLNRRLNLFCQQLQLYE